MYTFFTVHLPIPSYSLKIKFSLIIVVFVGCRNNLSVNDNDSQSPGSVTSEAQARSLHTSEHFSKNSDFFINFL